jgi:hypothetical protein
MSVDKRSCCQRGLFIEPTVAPDGKAAHEPGCSQLQQGDYFTCAGCCGAVLQRAAFDDRHGYCDKCNPLRMVEVKLPAALVDFAKVLWNVWLKKGDKP